MTSTGSLFGQLGTGGACILLDKCTRQMIGPVAKVREFQVSQPLEPGAGHILDVICSLVSVHARYAYAYYAIDNNFVSEYKFYFFRAINILSQILVICTLDLRLMSYENVYLFVKINERIDESV